MPELLLGPSEQEVLLATPTLVVPMTSTPTMAQRRTGLSTGMRSAKRRASDCTLESQSPAEPAAKVWGGHGFEFARGLIITCLHACRKSLPRNAPSLAGIAQSRLQPPRLSSTANVRSLENHLYSRHRGCCKLVLLPHFLAQSNPDVVTLGSAL